MTNFEFSLTAANESVAAIQEMRFLIESRKNCSTEYIERLESNIELLSRLATYQRPNKSSDGWHLAEEALRLFSSMKKCQIFARKDASQLVVAKTQSDVLWKEFKRLLSKSELPKSGLFKRLAGELEGLEECDIDVLSDLLLSIPLPTIYSAKREKSEPRRKDERSTKIRTPLLRVIAFLDGAAVASPQLIKSQTLYPIVLKVRGIGWPEDAVKLRLDLLTTVPESEFSVSEFVFEPKTKPEGEELDAEIQGHIKLQSGQSSLLDDLVFQIRAAFEDANGQFDETPVVGHDELRLRVVDDNRHPLMTGNRSLDHHIADLLIELIGEFPKVKAEMPDLLIVLQGLTRLMAAYAQEAVFKGRTDVKESEFQKQVVRDLRMQPELGQDVEEGTEQAGGETDVKFRDVTIELKVERKNGDRTYIREKYSKQPVQYSGVEAKQTSVLLVLDLTEKTQPPGDIREDITLEKVETHGGVSKKFPSYVFVFVLNGNLKNPSDYSK